MKMKTYGSGINKAKLEWHETGKRMTEIEEKLL